MQVKKRNVSKRERTETREKEEEKGVLIHLMRPYIMSNKVLLPFFLSDLPLFLSFSLSLSLDSNNSCNPNFLSFSSYVFLPHILSPLNGWGWEKERNREREREGKQWGTFQEEEEKQFNLDVYSTVQHGQKSLSPSFLSLLLRLLLSFFLIFLSSFLPTFFLSLLPSPRL